MVKPLVLSTMMNFAVALAVPRLTQHFGNGRLLAGALLIPVIGMAGPVTAESSYLTGMALPMLLIGAGQGAALSPLAVAGVAARLQADLAHRIAAALSAGAVVLALALLVVLVTVHPRGEAASATTQRC